MTLKHTISIEAFNVDFTDVKVYKYIFPLFRFKNKEYGVNQYSILDVKLYDTSNSIYDWTSIIIDHNSIKESDIYSAIRHCHGIDQLMIQHIIGQLLYSELGI